MLALLACPATARAAFDEPPPRNGAGVVLTYGLVPAFVINVEHKVAHETTGWLTAGAGSTRVSRASADDIRRPVFIGGLGARRYVNEFFFLHGDVTYVHISGDRGESVRAASSWSNRESRLAALFLPGLSAGLGFGAVGVAGNFYGELSFVARLVLAGDRPTFPAPNIYADGAIALIPAVAAGYRW
jgi:hypothetical protein